MSTLKACLVGGVGGRASKFFSLFNRVPDAELIACCDINEKALADYAKEHNITRTFVDYDDVLCDTDINIVMLCTPDYLHGSQTLAAIEAGKHVYVEVAMCDTSVDDCIRVVKAAERHNAKVQMGNQVRWWPSFNTLKHYVSSGKLGQIIYAESEYWHNVQIHGNFFRLNPDGTFQTDPPIWKTGYGYPAKRPLAHGGMHALDSLRWVLDEEFCEVTCYASDHGGVPCPGYTDEPGFSVALFKTPSNVIARVSESITFIRRYSLGGSVFGTKGSLEMDRRLFSSFPVETELSLYLTTREDMEKDPKGPATRIQPIQAPYDEALEDPQDPEEVRPGAASIAMHDLVEAIREDRQPLINVYEAARSSAAAICARISAREHRTIYIPPFFQRMK